MPERLSGFDWNAANRAHYQKHGVSIAEIEALFRNDPRVARICGMLTWRTASSLSAEPGEVARCSSPSRSGSARVCG
jgi:hypothetical protein